MKHLLRDRALKISALTTSTLVITSFAVVLTVLMPISFSVMNPVVGFSSSANSVSVGVADSGYDWSYAMDCDYGWGDYDWGYDGGYGMDGYDAGC